MCLSVCLFICVCLSVCLSVCMCLSASLCPQLTRPCLSIPELKSLDRRSPPLTVFLGQTARFECGVHGRPRPSVSWLKDDQPLRVDPSRMLVLPSGALELDEVQMLDQGTYVCRAENARGFELGPRTELSVNTNFGECRRTLGAGSGGGGESGNFL